MTTSRALWFLLALFTAVSCPACEKRNIEVDAGASDALDNDGLPSDTLNVGLSVDFTISNCPAVDAGADVGLAAGCCRAPAPATLTFVPITAGSVDRQLWQFGDETSSTLATPSHLYAIPQKYDVTLVVGGSAGSLAITKRACVDVVPNTVGGPCDVDVQCTTPATCTCGSQSQCAAPFLRGICTEGCRDAPCDQPAQCADLSLGGAATPQAPWRRPLCVASCETNADCGAGLVCRDLPGRFPAGKWIKGCFHEFPLPLGSSCRRPDGTLDSPACVSGLCADVGALGQCMSDCAAAECPAGTRCATQPSGQKLCVLTCSPGEGCNDDPWLSCQSPGAATVLAGAAPATMLCAAKPCTSDKNCPGGICNQADAGVSRCGHR